MFEDFCCCCFEIFVPFLLFSSLFFYLHFWHWVWQARFEVTVVAVFLFCFLSCNASLLHVVVVVVWWGCRLEALVRKAFLGERKEKGKKWTCENERGRWMEGRTRVREIEAWKRERGIEEDRKWGKRRQSKFFSKVGNFKGGLWERGRGERTS